jgi:chromosome segregation ATPase
MILTITLTISIIIFCIAIAREENRRKSKQFYTQSSREDSDVLNESNDNECEVLKQKLREKEDIISRLKGEYTDTNLKMETYLSLTKASQELILRNDERVRTVSKLWEEKAEQLEKQVSNLNEEIVQLKRQIEKSEDELNSHQHQVNNLNRQLADRDDRIEELESELEQLIEVDEKCHQRTLRIQQLEADLENLEELRRKETDKLRNSIRDKDSKIEELENICSEMRIKSNLSLN